MLNVFDLTRFISVVLSSPKERKAAVISWRELFVRFALQIAIVALCTALISLLSTYSLKYRRDAFFDWNNVLFPDNEVRTGFALCLSARVPYFPSLRPPAGCSLLLDFGADFALNIR